jgi:hypothetical protein
MVVYLDFLGGKYAFYLNVLLTYAYGPETPHQTNLMGRRFFPPSVSRGKRINHTPQPPSDPSPSPSSRWPALALHASSAALNIPAGSARTSSIVWWA